MMACFQRIRQLVALAGRGPMPTHFPDRITIMGMFNDIDWDRRRNQQQSCIKHAPEIADFSKSFKPGYWCFVWPGSGQSYTVADTRGKWHVLIRETGKVDLSSSRQNQDLERSSYQDGWLRCLAERLNSTTSTVFVYGTKKCTNYGKCCSIWIVKQPQKIGS